MVPQFAGLDRKPARSLVLSSVKGGAPCDGAPHRLDEQLGAVIDLLARPIGSPRVKLKLVGQATRDGATCGPSAVPKGPARQKVVEVSTPSMAEMLGCGVVELRGIEPLTSAVRLQRSPI